MKMSLYSADGRNGKRNQITKADQEELIISVKESETKMLL